MSGLSTTVSELEQQQKQRSELTDWINKQQAAVNDWASRKSKLRPETAKQELTTMNDLLVSVGDKRSQLITEMTGTCKLKQLLIPKNGSNNCLFVYILQSLTTIPPTLNNCSTSSSQT